MRLDNTLDASKLFHPGDHGILLLGYSGLNGSDVSAVLTTQENSYDNDRVMSGLEEHWLNHRLFQRDRDVKKSHAHHDEGWSSGFPGDNDELENERIQRRIRLTNQREPLART